MSVIEITFMFVFVSHIEHHQQGDTVLSLLFFFFYTLFILCFQTFFCFFCLTVYSSLGPLVFSLAQPHFPLCASQLFLISLPILSFLSSSPIPSISLLHFENNLMSKCWCNFRLCLEAECTHVHTHIHTHTPTHMRTHRKLHFMVYWP